MVQLLNVVNGVVAPGGQAGKLVAFDIGHCLWLGCMHNALFKAARSLMAVEAFAIVEWVIKFQGLLWPGDILYINVVQPTELGFEASKHGIIRVAGVAGLITRYTSILEMGRRNIRRVIYVQALAVMAHNVAAQAERRLLCPFHVVLKPQQPGKNGEDKERQKRQYLPAARYCQIRTQGDQAGQSDRYDENSQYQRRGHDAPCLKRVSTSLLQTANVFDQIFDLVIGQFAIEFRHFAFAFFGDLDQIGIAFLGYFG